VECGSGGIATSTADEVTWVVRTGALFVHRWKGGAKFATPKSLHAVDGERITFIRGKITQRIKP
jgi:hypothetical protein